MSGIITDFSSSESYTDLNGTFTSSGSTSAKDTDGYRRVSSTINVSSVSGTTPTLYVELQESNDSSNWSTVGSYSRTSTTGVMHLFNYVINARYYRYSYTIAGTNPSFTFSLFTTLKHGGGGGQLSMNRYSGIDTTNVGNVSESFQTKGCSNVGIIFRRGSDAGGSLQLRIDVSNDNLVWAEVTGGITIASGSALLGNNIVPQNFTSLPYRFYRARVTDDTSVATQLDLFWSANMGA